ncbi:protein FAM124A [Lingula anatina]|uniref:Protein FAM124A n=1 Tax=Lingula anatina TaxID=7574 RepID=A0A1S3IZ27_LINAN|nr:protein FAM124A [Lingula anatina]|eukprot:XP_013403460.1 protein FAM124A [Lingula anatina]
MEKCVLEITCSEKARQKLESLVMLMDPSFEHIHLKDSHSVMDVEGSLRPHRQCTTPGIIDTPALSVVLMLHENNPDLDSAKDQLKSWKFHHKIELSNVRTGKPRVVARQDFYEESPGAEGPLWSFGSVHLGNELLRFNMFVKDFKAMVHFYGLLTGKTVQYSKPGFCLFTLYKTKGLEVQLALKYSQYLNPVPTNGGRLRFQVSDIVTLKKQFPGKLIRLSEDVFELEDPDGNGIFIVSAKKNGRGSTLRRQKPLSKRGKSDDALSLSESHDSGRWSSSSEPALDPISDTLSDFFNDTDVFDEPTTYFRSQSRHQSFDKGGTDENYCNVFTYEDKFRDYCNTRYGASGRSVKSRRPRKLSLDPRPVSSLHTDNTEHSTSSDDNSTSSKGRPRHHSVPTPTRITKPVIYL